MGVNGRELQSICQRGTDDSRLRSENDIKNHVYAELRKGVRRVNTCLEFKFDFKDIRSISSSTLSELFEQENKKMDHINKNNRDEGIFFLLIRFAQDKFTN